MTCSFIIYLYCGVSSFWFKHSSTLLLSCCRRVMTKKTHVQIIKESQATRRVWAVVSGRLSLNVYRFVIVVRVIVSLHWCTGVNDTVIFQLIRRQVTDYFYIIVWFTLDMCLLILATASWWLINFWIQWGFGIQLSYSVTNCRRINGVVRRSEINNSFRKIPDLLVVSTSG